MKNSKSKILAVLLTTVGCFALGGCNKTVGTNDWISYDSSKSMTDAVTIQFYSNRTDLEKDGTFKNYITEFNKAEPNITVKVTTMKDYQGDLEKMMSAGSYGDVSMITLTDMTQLSSYYISYGSYDDLAAAKKYRNEYLYSKYYDGQVYGLPSMNTVGGVAYNKQVFTDAGVDASALSTPDKFVEGMQKIKDSTNGKAKDCIPYYTNAHDGWTANQWEDHFVNNVITGNLDYANNDIAIDSNVWKKDSNDPHYMGSKLYFDLIAKGLVEESPTASDWESSKVKINEGKIGAMVMGNWAISQFKAAGDNPDDIGYMPFPFTATDGTRYANSGSDYSYGISCKTDNLHREASERFVNWMVEKSGYALSQGGISVLKSDDMPSGLEAFSDCTFLVSNPAKTGWEDARANTESISKQALYDNGTRFSQIVAIATGTGTYDEKLASFNTTADTWNTAWAAAAAKVKTSLGDLVK